MALTEIDFQIFCFHGSLSQKGSRPLLYMIVRCSITWHIHSKTIKHIKLCVKFNTTYTIIV